MREPNPIAIAISDLHLSLLPPACRADKDWMQVQAHYLQQVKDWAQADQLPILCAGDIFDRWNAPPELINFALEHLPDNMICVPGQHDLPLHRMDLMHRSGYGVLANTSKIRDLSGKTSDCCRWIQVSGFGWEQDIFFRPKQDDHRLIQIALIHRYVWTADKKYPGAPATANVAALGKALKGYDIAICGDNHQGFLAQAGGCRVLNVGGFIRRKSDELDYEPAVGIIYSDGTVKRRRLDTSIDRFHEPGKERKEIPFDMKAFLDGLEGLGEHGLDFQEAVKNYLELEKVPAATAEIILAAMQTK